VVKIRKLKVFIITLLIAVFLLGTSYAIWKHDAEVSFRLTIKMSAGSGCECCNPVTYTTIQEGINKLKNDVYNCIYNKMENYKSKLYARIAELESLPFGDITYEELSAEVQQYRNTDIAGFGTCITKYGKYINDLAAFYNNSSQEKKDEVPDFWQQHDKLWWLSDQLWHKRDELYDIVDDLWDIGESKIDYNKKKNKDENGNETDETSEKLKANEAGEAIDTTEITETNEANVDETNDATEANETDETNVLSEDAELTES